MKNVFSTRASLCAQHAEAERLKNKGMRFTFLFTEIIISITAVLSYQTFSSHAARLSLVIDVTQNPLKWQRARWKMHIKKHLRAVKVTETWPFPSSENIIIKRNDSVLKLNNKKSKFYVHKFRPPDNFISREASFLLVHEQKGWVFSRMLLQT
jgi:hypothetical protein